MKKILFLIALLWPVVGIWAQNPGDDSRQRISEVKRAEGRYIYADQTSGTAEKALEQAQEMLLHEVLDYLQQTGRNTENAAAILKDQMVTITVQRGDKFRAFVYIDKQLDKVASETVKSDLVAESQKVEKPKKEEGIQVVVVEEPKKEKKPKKEEEIQVVVVEEPKKVDKPKKEEEIQVAVAEEPRGVILQQISSMKTRLQVFDYISELQKDGENVSFVSHPNEDNIESMYVLLYRRGGAIEAILTPADAQGQRRNVVTGYPDAIANHPATSVNGFILSEEK